MSAPRIVTDERVSEYVSRKYGSHFVPPFTAMGIERDGVVVAGVVFNNMTARDIEVSVAGERGQFTLGFLRAVGRYVFGQLNCSRLSITTRQEIVCDIARRLGAQMEGVKRDHFGPGQDAMLLGILKKDWAIR